MVNREQLIISTMPFHDKLIEWCKSNPDFMEALKIVYPERFIALHAIYTSSSPYLPLDEVIGFIVYDSKEKIFKQDFIVNLNKDYKNFILYTKLPGNMSKTYNKYIKPINDFYSRYGKKTHYLNTHHIKYDDLDEQLKPRATCAIALAEKLERNGLKQFTQEELCAIGNKLQKEKKN